MAMRFHLKKLLAEAKMTQRELAEKTGVRLPTISEISVGSIKRVPVGALEKICAVLHCQPGDLMEYLPDEE